MVLVISMSSMASHLETYFFSPSLPPFLPPLEHGKTGGGGREGGREGEGNAGRLDARYQYLLEILITGTVQRCEVVLPPSFPPSLLRSPHSTPHEMSASITPSLPSSFAPSLKITSDRTLCTHITNPFLFLTSYSSSPPSLPPSFPPLPQYSNYTLFTKIRGEELRAKHGEDFPVRNEVRLCVLLAPSLPPFLPPSLPPSLVREEVRVCLSVCLCSPLLPPSLPPSLLLVIIASKKKKRELARYSPSLLSLPPSLPPLPPSLPPSPQIQKEWAAMGMVEKDVWSEKAANFRAKDHVSPPVKQH